MDNISILSIESSCDETSAAVIKNGNILANIVATQEIHKEFGGVVPELASRAHQQNIIPVIHQALDTAKVSKNELNAVGYTHGPGLLGALLVGSSFAKSFAMGLNIPVIPVNHMQAHILAHFIDDPKPAFPFLCLTVSGGHTQIVLVRDYLDMKVVGQTMDDAVGEAFDKTAKLLGLPYPGGPMIDSLAQKGDGNRFTFGQVKTEGYNFSFSGIKTGILYFLQKNTQKDPDFAKNNIEDIAASVQKTLIDLLLQKFEAAAMEYNVSHLAIAGGVAANSGLRARIAELAQKHNWKSYIPKFEYCTDNAAMIAMTAHYMYLGKQFGSLTDGPDPRLTFEPK